MEITIGSLYQIKTRKGWYSGLYNKISHNVYNELISLKLGDIVLLLSKEIVPERQQLLSPIQPLTPRVPRVAYNFLYKNVVFYDIYDMSDINNSGLYIQEALRKI